MHFSLGRCPKPHWGSLQYSPPLSWWGLPPSSRTLPSLFASHFCLLGPCSFRGGIIPGRRNDWCSWLRNDGEFTSNVDESIHCSVDLLQTVRRRQLHAYTSQPLYTTHTYTPTDSHVVGGLRDISSRAFMAEDTEPKFWAVRKSCQQIFIIQKCKLEADNPH